MVFAPSAVSPSQVQALNSVVLEQLAAGACQTVAPKLQNIAAVGNGQGLAGVLLHQQNRHSQPGQADDFIKDEIHEKRRKAQGGLVQNHQPGAQDPGAAQRQKLALAA